VRSGVERRSAGTTCACNPLPRRGASVRRDAQPQETRAGTKGATDQAESSAQNPHPTHSLGMNTPGRNQKKLQPRKVNDSSKFSNS
jgi:hypothetical protein